MKKLIITTLATSVVALGAFAQGSITKMQTMFVSDGITTPGLNATSPSLATTWYTGNIALELFYASLGSVTSGQIAAINALDGTVGGGAAALALMNSDGFVLASTTTLMGSTPGSIAFAVNQGYLSPTSNPNTVGLTGVPTGVNAWIAMYAVGSTAPYIGYSGVLAFAQNTGGSPIASPPGTAANMATDPVGENLVLEMPIPEPATLALVGLGSLSLMLFRRKNS